MQRFNWIVVALAFLLGGWLAGDGARALLIGDYITRSSGPYAGQLGPWSRVVTNIGLEPRGTFVKWVHVCLGIGWIIATLVFLRHPPSGWWMMFGCAIASLWYVPFGTVVGIGVMALLLAVRSTR